MNSDITDYLKLHPVDSTPFTDKRESLESRIYRILQRTKFRSAGLSDTAKQFIQEHIKAQVAAKQPIIMVYAMGGGRGINTNHFPHADWGEFLHLKFFVENLMPIADIYEPGVEVRWSLDDYAARIFNNYKEEWQDTYIKGFDAMLDYFTNASGNKIRHVRYPTSTWYPDFDALKKKLLEDAEAKMQTPEAAEIIAGWSKRATNNYYNVDNLQGEALQKAIEFSTIINNIWLDYDFGVRIDFFTSGIMVAHFTAFPDCYYIQTVPGTNTQFWKGNGYVERDGNGFKSRIATRTAWAEIENNIRYIPNPLASDLSDLAELPILEKN